MHTNIQIESSQQKWKTVLKWLIAENSRGFLKLLLLKQRNQNIGRWEIFLHKLMESLSVSLLTRNWTSNPQSTALTLNVFLPESSGQHDDVSNIISSIFSGATEAQWFF